ncbi:MAG: hypothetical protein IPK39_20555 [Sulfuritalea sp.]|nr:hypothetical protein [Sulfuritalea sp.]
MIRKTLIATAVASAFVASPALAQVQGPSSSKTPYVIPTAPGWSVTSILTVGDEAVNKYKMVGIPDGLGAYDNGPNSDTFTVLMNHELGDTQGVARAHGSKGAFVSEWVINKNTLQVVSGQDLVQSAANVPPVASAVATPRAPPASRACARPTCRPSRPSTTPRPTRVPRPAFS